MLVDRETASASEIVTGALQDRDRATVVGTRTFGKGVFQEIEELPNGGALDITVGEYFTPSGRNLGGGGPKRGAGITPDVKAQDNDKTKRDEALDVAAAHRARAGDASSGRPHAGRRGPREARPVLHRRRRSSRAAAGSTLESRPRDVRAGDLVLVRPRPRGGTARSCGGSGGRTSRAT